MNKQDIQKSMDENTKKQSLEAMQVMVEKDKAVSEKLMVLLKKEAAVIKQKNYDSLNEILSKKTPLLDQLKHHADIRRQWLTSLFKVTSETHWKTFMESFEQPEISIQWEEVNRNINRCKELNEINGLLISRGQKTYEQLLFLLKGGNRQSDTYTSKGSKQSIRAYGTVAKA